MILRNGLIKQWGTYIGNTIIYPLKFTNINYSFNAYPVGYSNGYGIVTLTIPNGRQLDKMVIGCVYFDNSHWADWTGTMSYIAAGY